jgi:gliding motility-associated-like protein
MMSLFNPLLLLLCFVPVTIRSQINNCVGAQVVCDSEDLTLNPQGPGIDDFADEDNDPGCMVDLENNTAWYYFEMNESAPSGLELGFIIHPNGGFGEDYDWALYGPDVKCNNLGSPIRCSSSSAQCDFCPETGMGMGTMDVSEGPGSGDGFVMTLQVAPGQGFFLMIDNWQGTNNGFVLSWTGSAAAHLNCDAEVPCDIVAEAGPPILTCGGDQSPLQLTGSAVNTNGNETYHWSGTNGGTDFLSDPGIANPFIHLPADFSGVIIYTLTVSEDSCTSRDNVTLTVISPEVNITPVGPFCETGPSQILSASPPGGIWGGAVTGNLFDPALPGPGVHTVTYTYTNDNPPCVKIDSIEIEVFSASDISLILGQDIELMLGENAFAEAVTNIPAEEIDSVTWSPAGIVECLDPACLRVMISPLNDVTLVASVYDRTGCSASDDMRITVQKNRKVYIPTVFSPNDDGINDRFFISEDHHQIARIKKLVIYNRWGAVVHEAHDFLPGDQSHDWTGYDGDQKMNPGVFVYAVEVEFLDGWVETLTGDLTLIR